MGARHFHFVDCTVRPYASLCGHHSHSITPTMVNIGVRRYSQMASPGKSMETLPIHTKLHTGQLSQCNCI